MRNLALLALLATVSACASAPPPPPSGHNMSMQIDIPPATGNADVDFVAQMIPHHQMAVDMANDELKNGTDPFALTLARQVKDSQTKEISDMQDWLKKQPVKPHAQASQP